MTRPKMPQDERKGVSIILRCTEAAREEYKAAAEKKGLSLSDWLRGLADAALKRKKGK